jgi:hypothetical protein
MRGMIALTSPLTANNLTAWFVTTTPAASLLDYSVIEEGLENQTALLHETGEVNQLLIENLGDTDLFIQAGDVVKGGRQDRTLGTDFIVPARSGKIPVPAFCVERRRWGRRGGENTVFFSSCKSTSSSKKLRIAIRSTKSQGDVWAAVAEDQAKLSKAANVSVAAAASPSSLQLSYESKQLHTELRTYVDILGAGLPEGVTGVVWAINGRLSHADLYGSSKLFQKLWKKLLNAAALEALAESDEPPESIPQDIHAVREWLERFGDSQPEEESLPPRTRITTRRDKTQFRFESYDIAAPSATVHESVIDAVQ